MTENIVYQDMSLQLIADNASLVQQLVVLLGDVTSVQLRALGVLCHITAGKHQGGMPGL
jgi:hypothetical protein